VDLVVANPPYLSEQEYQSASREVSGYEPRQALVGGDRGDELSRRLLESCGEVLRPGGRLFMEGSEKRTADLARIATMEPGVWAEAAVVKDLGGQDRILALRRM
jgi:release factor glutamine methyltransferase